MGKGTYEKIYNTIHMNKRNIMITDDLQYIFKSEMVKRCKLYTGYQYVESEWCKVTGYDASLK